MKSKELNVIDDRGPAKYFHGRKQEINFFKHSLEQSQKRGLAKSILIQGPPGVGKTALIDEFKKKLTTIWRVVELNTIIDLANPIQCAHLLIGRKKFQKKAKEIGLDLKVLKGKIEYEKTEETISEIISLIDTPTLLILDEAQMAEIQLTKGSDPWRQVSVILNGLHNLKNEHGFVCLFGGLSNTQNIFHDFKISRFYTNAIIDLQRIDQSSEKAILKDYIVQEAHVDPHHPDLDHWLDQLSKETLQWPHHIVCYAETASKMLKKHNGVLSDHVLGTILGKGLALKNDYYQRRFYKISPRMRCFIYHAIFENEMNPNTIDVDTVLDDFELNPYIKEPKKTWNDLVSRGIVQVQGNGFYQIPIPSMRTWMIGQYQAYCQTISLKPSMKIQRMFDTLTSSKTKDLNSEIKPTG